MADPENRITILDESDPQLTEEQKLEKYRRVRKTNVEECIFGTVICVILAGLLIMCLVGLWRCTLDGDPITFGLYLCMACLLTWALYKVSKALIFRRVQEIRSAKMLYLTEEQKKTANRENGCAIAVAVLLLGCLSAVTIYSINQYVRLVNEGQALIKENKIRQAEREKRKAREKKREISTGKESTTSGSSSKSSKSSEKSETSMDDYWDDYFNVEDFYNPEDFYDYYWDDFFDYEEAESYYYDHGGK